MYVRGVTRRPVGKAAGRRITPTEKLVLRVLASFYRDELACAYGSLGDYTAACGLQSERHVRGVIAGLEEAGLLLRSAMQRGRDGSQTTSLLEFPLMGYAAEGMVCPVAEWPMRRAAWSRVEMQRAEFFRDARRPMGRAAVQMKLEQPGPPVDCQPGPPVDCQPPSELYEELYRDQEPPAPPLAAVERGKPCAAAPTGGGGAAGERLPGMGKATATASATANATTPERQAASGAQNGVSRAGLSPGAGEPERRERAPRHATDAHALDGEDAAWHAEVTRVLRALGVVDSAGLRHNLLMALQLEAERSRCTIGAVGQLAVQRWQEYHNEDLVMAWYPEPKRFFRDGLWLRPQAWKVSEPWLARVRERNRSAAGSRWAN